MSPHKTAITKNKKLQTTKPFGSYLRAVACCHPRVFIGMLLALPDLLTGEIYIHVTVRNSETPWDLTVVTV